jgi:hypothetical protein
MNKLKTVICGSLILLIEAAASSGGLEISWHTIDGGGEISSAGGAFQLGSTIGQPEAQVAPVMSGGTFELTGGFWPVAQVCYCPGDLNGDGIKDGRDIQQFLSCVLASGNCPCADVDVANGVNLADVPVFVTNLLAGSNCP